MSKALALLLIAVVICTLAFLHVAVAAFHPECITELLID